ncbi:MAG: ATP-binding protein [Clostridiales bacterium]|nr:ATP-binding protein [Clostridiales bacterium]
MAEKKPTVLVIDDEEAMRDSCSLILARGGYAPVTAENGEVGLEKIRELKPEIALIDLKMPGISGFEVLEKTKDIDPQLIPIVITGYATVDSAVEAMKKGAYDFLPKPFAPEELRLIISRALERRRLAMEAETLRREKKLMEDNFITMVTHQLRSPLVAIQQYFEVILAGLAGQVDKTQQEMILRARERLDNLLGLINDWLDLARIDRGQIVDKLKPVALDNLLKKQVEFLAPLAKEYEVSLELKPAKGPVLGDEQMLDQAFSNIITNAIKYNKPKGSVTISMHHENSFIVVKVEDTGIGIAREHLPFIFDQFYRVSRREDQKIKGTGLGLSIAKKIVEAHNGSIEVESEPGQGSTFSVRLPRSEDETK